MNYHDCAAIESYTNIFMREVLYSTNFDHFYLCWLRYQEGVYNISMVLKPARVSLGSWNRECPRWERSREKNPLSALIVSESSFEGCYSTSTSAEAAKSKNWRRHQVRQIVLPNRRSDTSSSIRGVCKIGQCSWYWLKRWALSATRIHPAFQRAHTMLMRCPYRAEHTRAALALVVSCDTETLCRAIRGFCHRRTDCSEYSPAGQIQEQFPPLWIALQHWFSELSNNIQQLAGHSILN